MPADDWPPRDSASRFSEGTRRHGSTGQLWEVRDGVWVRVNRPKVPVLRLVKTDREESA